LYFFVVSILLRIVSIIHTINAISKIPANTQIIGTQGILTECFCY